MKKLATLILLFWSIGMMAQDYFGVSGTVTDAASGAPVYNQEMVIAFFNIGDSTLILDEIVETNEMGYYEFEGPFNVPMALVQVGTIDCNGVPVYEFGTVSINNPWFEQDFEICTGGGGDCHAFFEYYLTESLRVEFENLSEGEDLTYFWTFGDGTNSDEENPVHTYAMGGDYVVTLYIATADSSCFDVYEEMIHISNGQGDCEAYFEYYVGDGLTVEFENFSEGENLVYFWSFGDGSGSDEENPTHTYASGGEYRVSLFIINGDSTCIDDYDELIYVGGGQGDCEAYFTYEQEDAYTFNFVNMSEGENLMYYWAFGDDTYSTEENPVHTYNMDGYYLVALMITNEDSTCFDFYEDMVIVGDSTPGDCQAYFEYYYAPNDGYRVEFENLSEGNDLVYYWDFGDGNFSQEENPEHTYERPGIYEVCLMAASEDSTCYDVYCAAVVIDDMGACIAQFAYYPDSLGNYTYQFVDLSYGDIESWYWDFGDGTYSDDQNPAHTFSEEGYYYVCLTITCEEDCGDKGEDCTSTWCEEVYVGEYEDCFNFFTYQTVGNSVLFEGFHSSMYEAWYTWEFGDGTSGEGQITEHTYDATGTYFVTLTSVSEDSCFATSSQVIVVGDSIVYHQVYGQVFEGDFPMDRGMVMIFSTEAGPNYEPFFDMAMIDSSGIYVLPYVPNGEFYVYAIPFNWNGYLPTYYGDVINWDEATPIVLGEPENPYDIHLVAAEFAATPGNGSITGTIYNGGVRASYIDKIQMLLYNDNYEILGFTDVNEEGSFDLSNLANGTYYIYPELSGVSSEFTQVQITDEQQNVVVNMTMEGSTILGEKELFMNTEAGNIFPNPADERARIELNNLKETQVKVQVMDITGRTQIMNEYNLSAGRTVIEIRLEHLQTGIYFVRITNTEGNTITRKVVHQ